MRGNLVGMEARPYRDAADVEALQRFMAETWAATDGCGCLHPGDIPHHLFSGNKLYDPAEICTIWEDEVGVAAFLIVNPRFRENDLHVRPDVRSLEWERELVTHGDAELIRLMDLHGVEADRITAVSWRCDTLRAQALEDCGWLPLDEPPWRINRRALVDIPDPIVPDGYTIRQVGGVEEAADLALVHAASFGSTWTEEMYRRLMESPGYAPEREWVAIADDGEYAAFTVTWRDHLNKTGLFEPVGTHRDHRRRGLGAALLYTVMHAMADEGMTHAIVESEGSNEASNALYQSVGFTPWHFIDDWFKPLVAGAA
jgi:ribosomal protein S18 acetylase RimI-like enzyme